jgi:alpha-beta hydrolase superfamily lysophospholipase
MRRPLLFYVFAAVALVSGCSTLDSTPDVDGGAPLGKAVQAPAAGMRIGNQYVLDPSLAGSEREFQTRDDSTLGYIAYRAPGATTALVYLHGIESHAGWFAQAATLLQDHGYDVFSLDRRGSGINRENRGYASGHIDHYQILLDDIHDFITPLRERYRHVFLVGLSWGGKLATAYELGHPDDVDGLVLITPGIKALVDVSLATKLKIVLFSQFSPQSPIASPIAPEMFTTTPRYLDYIKGDPSRLTHATARFYWQSSRLDSYLASNIASLDRPTLLFLAGQDRIIDNAGVLGMLNRGNTDKLTVIDYPDQTHSVQFDDPDRLVQDMDHWLQRQLTNTIKEPAQAP